jgi:MFS family permease
LTALPAGIAMGAVGLAVFVQASEIGGPRALGFLGLVQFGFLTLGVVGGSAVVDHMDRRRLLLLTQLGFVISVMALLVASVIGDPPIVLLYVTSAWGSAVASVHFPTRSAMIPPVVDRSDLTDAMTLDMVVWNVTMIVGPILGGALLARFGLPGVYLVGAVLHVVALTLMLPLGRQTAGDQRQDGLGVRAIRRGFAYVRPRRVLRGLLWIDLIAMTFGMRRALFPILAVEQFHRGPQAVGLMMAAIPAGALVVSLTAGWLNDVHRQGRWLVAAALTWGVAITAFGLSGSNFGLGLLLLAIGGGADIVAAILRATIIQHEVPDSVRGRVWGGPRLGDMTAGITAAAWGATASVVVGGIAAVVGAGAYAIAAPELRRYTSSDGIMATSDRRGVTEPPPAASDNVPTALPTRSSRGTR